MDVFFVDDSAQARPSREAMGRLIGVGGIHVPAEHVRDLERSLARLCSRTGFPMNEEFKWSPGRRLWMSKGLVDERRERFFEEALRIAMHYRSRCIVVIEDTRATPATNPRAEHLLDATAMFLERANAELRYAGKFGIVVIDRPSGGAAEDSRYLASCFETLQIGTKFVVPDRIAINVLSTSSGLVRLLQLADVIVSCSVSFVAGEDRYSPPIFRALLPMFYRGPHGIGGIGLKIHPDHNYVNLYHWLLGDKEFKKGRFLQQLPIPASPYALSDRRWRQ